MSPRPRDLGQRLSEKLREQGLLLRASDHGIGFGPPLCITRSEVDEIVAGVDRALSREFFSTLLA